MVIWVVLGAALVGAVVAGLVAWRLPNFDPAAPRAAARSVRRQVREHPRVAAFLRRRADPAVLTGLGLTIALAVVIAATIAIGSLLIMVNHNTGLAHYDLGAARWGGSHATSGSTQFLRDVSLFGGTPMMFAVCVIVAIVEFRRTRTLAVFGFLTVIALGQVTIVNLTKAIVDRARPDISRLTGFSGASFPSGHAATAAATFAAIALLLGRGRDQRVKALLAAAAAAIAVGVATTRVLLGVHWMTDVIAGLAMGWAWFALTSIAFGGRLLVFGQPAAVAEAAAQEAELDPTGAALSS